VKKVTSFAVVLYLGTVFLTGARADDPEVPAQTVAEKLALEDPDGVPIVITHPEKHETTPTEEDAERKQEEEAATQKDWLLRAYEQIAQSRTHDASGAQENNLYYRIASDKNLAKLAGLSYLETPQEESTAALRTGDNDSGKSVVTLRPDPVPSENGSHPKTSLPIIQPFITPLDAANAAGLHNFYETLPAATTPLAASTAPPSSNNEPIQNPADFDTPGQIAAENDPLGKDSSNLTFGMLPDETLPGTESHHADASDGDLPLSTDEAQIRKLTDTSITVPGSIKTVPPASVSSLEVKVENDPAPIKLVSPVVVRQPIASPFSILDR